MAILPIVTYPHPVLTTPGKDVEHFDDNLRQLIADMLETMYISDGVGLAAPQIGKSLNLFVIDCTPPEEGRHPLVFVNPVIVSKSNPVLWNEGCLSLPGLFEDVPTFARCTVEAFDGHGKAFRLEATELLSVAILHEYEHLQGHVFIERLNPIKKKMTQKFWKKNRDALTEEAEKKRKLRSGML